MSKQRNMQVRDTGSLLIACILCLVLTITNTQSAKQDIVHIAIPGYENHTWYSGYLDFDMGKFHYVFFESQRDPNKDPVLLWLNGGPGCSSLIGMFYENGPFVFNEGKTSFSINPHSWNMKANVLYLESPGGVGFSQGSRQDQNSDVTVAEDNFKALLQFFKKFPTYKNNEFYIAGESYAGVYVPYLAYQIVNYNKRVVKELNFNLKGFMVGNPCTDPRECYEPGADANVSIYQYEFLHNHGFYTDQDYLNMKGACMMGYHGQECGQIRKNLDKKFQGMNTSLLNIYAPCFYNQQKKSTSKKRNERIQMRKKLGLATFVDCDDHFGIDHYLNEPITQKQLHVDPIHFQICSDNVAEHYKLGENQSYWLYPELIKTDLRIWVYSGDLDADVPITGTLHWLQRLRDEGNIPIEEPWRQWWVPGKTAHEDQVGGLSWRLKELTFATVKGAGHMAPKDQKKAASILFNSFIAGSPLPYKDQSK